MAYSMGVVVLVSALCMTGEALLDVINHTFDEDEMDGICVQERIYNDSISQEKNKKTCLKTIFIE